LADELARWEANAADLATLRSWHGHPPVSCGAGVLAAPASSARGSGAGGARRTSSSGAGRCGGSTSGGTADRRETVHHPDAPLLVDLDVVRLLGIAGPRRLRLPLARSLVGQLAVGCSPRELRIEVLAEVPRATTTGVGPAATARAAGHVADRTGH
jgi:hypothetical protein